MNLYTCKHYFPFAPIIIVLLVPLSLGIYYLFNFVNKNPFVEKPNKLLTSGIILVLVGIILLSIYLSAYINDYKSIFAKRNTAELQTIEGTITNLVTCDFFASDYDKFEINGVEFTVSARSMQPGYSRVAAHGGVLNKEGMYVKISYIECKNERYIMSIYSY